MPDTEYVYLSMDTKINIAGDKTRTLRELFNKNAVALGAAVPAKDFADHLQRAIDGKSDCGMFALEMSRVRSLRKYALFASAIAFAVSVIAFVLMQHHGLLAHWLYPVGLAVISLGVALIVSLWSSPAVRKGAAVFASGVGGLLLLAGILAVFSLLADRPKQFARIAMEMQGDFSESLQEARASESDADEGFIALKGAGTVTCTNAASPQAKP